PLDCRDAARLAARWHGHVHRAAELRAATWLALLDAADALRRPERLQQLVEACECDKLSRPGSGDRYEPAELVREAVEVVRGLDAGAFAAQVIARAAAQGERPSGDAIAQAVRAARLRALARWRKARRSAATAPTT
ncbi:MAG TPA: hypothetical protein VFX05_03505, partial [Casimicrobiaceae bacterium]|nr:hypothetical protein [Casimicrobiaceae bacterium]